MTIDKNFYGLANSLLISKLIKNIQDDYRDLIISVEIKNDIKINGGNTLKSSLRNELSFFDNKRYLSDLNNTKSGCIIVKPEFSSQVNPKLSKILTNSPRKLFGLCLGYIFSKNFVSKKNKEISESSIINQGVIIGNGVKIEKDVKIGANSVIGHGVTIKQGAQIGSNCTIDYSIIGENSLIYPGARIGTTGFGFDFDENGVFKFPHLGRVLIGKNVEIGANSTIDRGSLEDTVIKDNVMIDNLVHVAHNVKIGKGCVICGQSGFAGSSTLGDGVIMGAQAGISGHICIASGTILSARSGVTKSILKKDYIGGFPAVPISEFRKQIAVLRKLSRK